MKVVYALRNVKHYGKMTDSHCLCFKQLANSSGQIHTAIKQLGRAMTVNTALPFINSYLQAEVELL